MPVTRCLFAQPLDAVRRFVLDDPELAKEAYFFSRCEGLELPEEGLLVVRLPYRYEPGGAPPRGLGAEEGWLRPALQRFRWLDEVLPAPELAARLWRLAQESGAGLAWFYWFERGDDLYADAAWVFDAREERLMRPWLTVSRARTGQALYVRATFLMGGPESHSYYQGPPAEDLPWDGSPLQEALPHTGAVALTQYFIPADQSRFDWEAYRLRGP
jgi:hypothetical protein